MRRSLIVTLLAALGMFSLPANAVKAATLTGDTVFMSLTGSTSITVGAGVDHTSGAFQFDFNAGSSSNEFVFNDNGGFFGTSFTSLSLTSLNFSGGANLVGFNVLQTSLPNLSFILTATSLTFSWNTIGFGLNTGPSIRGEFITSDLAPVPLPAALPLFPTILAGGGLIAWRRKRKAAKVATH